MTGYVNLIGADAVQSASYVMRDAANNMQGAASTIDVVADSFIRRLDELVSRLEAPATPECGCVNCSGCKFAVNRAEEFRSKGKTWMLVWSDTAYFECHRRAPVLAVDGAGDELGPFPLMGQHGFCGEGVIDK